MSWGSSAEEPLLHAIGAAMRTSAEAAAADAVQRRAVEPLRFHARWHAQAAPW